MVRDRVREAAILRARLREAETRLRLALDALARTGPEGTTLAQLIGAPPDDGTLAARVAMLGASAGEPVAPPVSPGEP